MLGYGTTPQRVKALRNHFNIQLHWQALRWLFYFIMFNLNKVTRKF